MKRFMVFAALFACAVMGLVICLSANSTEAVEFYGRNLRASLFTGLLTVGSFLLSLKVFIVVKFKETVFDTPAYRDRFKERRKIDPSLQHYAQVRNLSRVLFAAIASALFASVSQVTVGLVAHVAALTFCVFAASFAAAMLLQTLLLIRVIIAEWLDQTEEKASEASGG